MGLGIGKFIFRLKLYCQYKLIVFFVRNNINNIENISNGLSGNNLIVIPHADDELIGCHQLIVENSNTILYYINFKNEKYFNADPKVRERELLYYSRIVNRRIIVSRNTVDKSEEMFNIIINNNIDNVFIPSFIDWHDEHFEISKILYDIIDKYKLNSNKNIYMYSISLPHPTAFITHYCDLDKSQFKYKWYMFDRVYFSQKHLPLLRFKLKERLFGKYVKTYSAEMYVKLSVVDWTFYFKKYIMKFNSQLKEQLLNNLNNIQKINKTINDIYEKYLR